MFVVVGMCIIKGVSRMVVDQMFRHGGAHSNHNSVQEAVRNHNHLLIIARNMVENLFGRAMLSIVRPSSISMIYMLEE